MKRLLHVFALCCVLSVGVASCGGSSSSSSSGGSDSSFTSAGATATTSAPSSAASAGDDDSAAEPVKSPQGFSTVVPGGRKDMRWTLTFDGKETDTFGFTAADLSQIQASIQLPTVESNPAAFDAALKEKVGSGKVTAGPTTVTVDGESGRSITWRREDPADPSQTTDIVSILVNHNGKTFDVFLAGKPDSLKLDQAALDHVLSAWKWTS